MKILIACGGTAGHLFPGLALAEELSHAQKQWQVVMVVSARPRDREALKAAGYLNGIRLETVSCLPLPYKISFKYLPFCLVTCLAFLKSFYLLLKYNPRAVIGFGGYASVWPLIAGRFLGIPTLIHEQNLLPGRANRLLARIVDRTAITFADTSKFLHPQLSARVIMTGFPLRQSIISQTKGITKDSGARFTVFVVGGSQGAHSLNTLVLDCLSSMERPSREQIHFIHLSGKKDLGYVQSRYAALGASSRVFDFVGDIASLYIKADLVISRSGAGTIFEIANFGLPCILVPHSFGTRHQRENALYLQKRGAALVLDEQRQTAEDLKKMLLELITEPGLRQDLSKKIKMLEVPQARSNLKTQIDILCNLVK